MKCQRIFLRELAAIFFIMAMLTPKYAVASLVDDPAVEVLSGTTSVTITTPALTVSGTTSLGDTLGVTGATSLSTVSTSGLATLNSATVTGLSTLDGGITADSGAFTVADTTGNVATTGTLGVTGATTLSTVSTSGLATLNSATVTGLSTLSGGITADNFTVADTSGDLTATGTTNIIGAVGSSANTLTGATNTLTGSTSSSMTGNNANVNLSANNASMSVTGGSTVTATNTQLTALTADNQGLTVNNAGSTTLTGGTNSSTLTLADAQATLGVGTASTAEITVLNATNTAGVTSVTIGGSSNASNQLLATGTGGTNDIQAATTNTLTAGTNNILGAAQQNQLTGGTGNTITATTGNNTMTATTGNNVITGVNNMITGVTTITSTTTANQMIVDASSSRFVSADGYSNATVYDSSVSLAADTDASTANAGSSLSMAPTSASLYVRTDSGVSHGIAVGQTSTVISGGTTSTSLTLDDTGATFQNDVTSGPATVTGVADGVADYDAVNMRQYRKLEDRIDKSWSGIASIAALSAIPAPVPGKNISLGIGYGNFQSRNAFAAGTKALVGENRNTTLTAGVGFCDNTTTISAGVGWSF